MIRRIRVEGRVQGVCFRDWAVTRARALGLAGWVRNRNDGSVELVASGADATVEALIAACRDGPAAARVDRIAVTDEAEAPDDGFVRRPTAGLEE